MGELKPVDVKRNMNMAEGYSEYSPVTIVQGTNLGTRILISVYNNSEVYKLSENSDIRYTISGVRPDRKRIKHQLKVEDNKLIFDSINSYITHIAGAIKFSIAVEEKSSGNIFIFPDNLEINIIENPGYTTQNVDTDDMSVD